MSWMCKFIISRGLFVGDGFIRKKKKGEHLSSHYLKKKMYFINYILVFRKTKKGHKYWHNDPLLKIRKEERSNQADSYWKNTMYINEGTDTSGGHRLLCHHLCYHTALRSFSYQLQTSSSTGNIKQIRTKNKEQMVWVNSSSCLRLWIV